MLIMVTAQLRKPLREIAKTFMSVSVLVGSVVVLICPLPMMYSAPRNPTIRALCEVENMNVPVT